MNIEELKRTTAQRDELLAAARRAVIALARASEGDSLYQAAYGDLSAAIAKVEG